MKTVDGLPSLPIVPTGETPPASEIQTLVPDFHGMTQTCETSADPWECVA